jgi:hypothetical protein
MAVIEYRRRDASRISGDVSAIGERIEDLKRRNIGPGYLDGFVTAREVLEDGRDPSSPLHSHFTWDGTKAALKWNLYEARRLIRCYEIKILEPNREPLVIGPANVHIHTKGAGSRFVSSSFAMSHEALRNQVLADAARLLDGARKRLLSIQGISPEIISLFEKLSELIGREKASAAAPKKRRSKP